MLMSCLHKDYIGLWGSDQQPAPRTARGTSTDGVSRIVMCPSSGVPSGKARPQPREVGPVSAEPNNEDGRNRTTMAG